MNENLENATKEGGNLEKITSESEILNAQQKPRKNKFLHVLKWTGKSILFVFECLFYLLGTLFCINFLLDLFDNKKGKK